VKAIQTAFEHGLEVFVIYTETHLKGGL